MKTLIAFALFGIFSQSTFTFAATTIDINAVDTVRIVKLVTTDYMNGVFASGALTSQIIKICRDQNQALDAALVKCGFDDGAKWNTYSCLGVCK